MASYEELQRQVEIYLTETGMSASEFAKRIGKSTSTISQWRSGIYKTPETVSALVEEFLHREQRRDEHAVEDFYVPISTSQMVYDTIEYCHLRKKLGIVYGDAGTGKTQGALEYIRKNQGSLIVTINPLSGTKSGLINAICQGVGIDYFTRRADDFSQIISRIEGRDIVLIVDEAQMLRLSALELLRSIHDASQVGMVLIGNHQIWTRMNGRNEAAFAQLFSRIAFQTRLSTTLVQMEDVRMLWPGMSEDAHKALLEIAQSRWGVRGATNIADQARLADLADGQSIRALARRHGIFL